MDVMLVLESFRTIAGLTEEEAKTWLPLCHWAIASVYGKLRSDTDLVKHQQLLAHAAAAMAYYKYRLRQSSQNSSADFSVGDVTIKEHTDETLKSARELYDLALESIRFLFEDDFAFVEVPS